MPHLIKLVHCSSQPVMDYCLRSNEIVCEALADDVFYYIMESRKAKTADKSWMSMRAGLLLPCVVQ